MTVNVMDRIKSTSIIILDQNFNANYVDIMVFEPSVLFPPPPRRRLRRGELNTWSTICSTRQVSCQPIVDHCSFNRYHIPPPAIDGWEFPLIY